MLRDWLADPEPEPVTAIDDRRRGADGRDRDRGRPGPQRRPRDGLGPPLPRGADGVERVPDDLVLPPEESLAEAQRLLDAGRPFHAHEVLEGTWKAAPRAERDLWQGLAQLAVGLTHRERGNATGAATLLRPRRRPDRAVRRRPAVRRATSTGLVATARGARRRPAVAGQRRAGSGSAAEDRSGAVAGADLVGAVADRRATTGRDLVDGQRVAGVRVVERLGEDHAVDVAVGRRAAGRRSCPG